MQQGFLGPGDELRLDAVRFVLVAPGMEVPAQASRTRPADPVARPARAVARKWVPIALTAAVLITIAALVLG